ncbi:P-loop containing nucleoside triphosphate hydrolase protein [Sphaerosporella brunnea]|uniref:P-loop containing nucleoside triphosphate hydrolase protein n=1 Tax=Sphaerosporella brunnea TaxID=1250544 RepID=A0A5J5F5X4_9PEZI|nr:P-loop containing nucleoside triphosphate hydrolase protein [Sphaerosporella brunnea]
MRNLYAVHFVNAVPAIRISWANKLLKLCAICTSSPACHGIQSDIERWRAVKEAVSALEGIQKHGQQNSNQAPSQAVPSLLVLRKLDKDEKKTRSRTADLTPARLDDEFPLLPDRIIAIMNELQCVPPRSYRATEALLEQLQAIEIPALIDNVLATFPCRPCSELAKNPKELLAKSTGGPSTNAVFTGFPKEPAMDSLFGGKIGLWKVLLSAEALKDIQKLSLAGNIDILKARLLQLASGDWKGGSFFKTGPRPGKKHLDSHLYAVGVGKQLRILWQIDVARCEDGLFRQHIKIWRVVDQKDIPKAIDHVVLVHRNQIVHMDDGYDFSKFPTRDAFGNNIPCEFHSTPHSRKENQPPSSAHAVPISVADRKALELYNKFYEFTQPVMKSFESKTLLAEFPFDTSPEEAEVIKHDQSGTLIMGRSGTGKTTCLVQKIVWNCTAQRAVIGQDPMRQILLTRSKLLVEKLKVYTKRLVESQLSKTISTTPVKLDVHDTLAEESLLHAKTLGKLTLEDFPLVVTFDGLLKILENTVAEADRQKFYAPPGQSIKKEAPGQYVRRAQTVDFALFRSEYWRRFPPNLTKKYEPGLVFAEILGVIKGSAFLHTGAFGSLCRDEYLSLSHKQAPTFSAHQREGVYDIYRHYERQKLSHGDKDGIDRVLGVLKFLASDTSGIIQGFMEEIYVDEVQDQRCIDIKLLLMLVKNPRGIHLAGDTAQCISQDSTFRFSHVKRMFFEAFAHLSKSTDDRTLAVPALFKLTRNFRSHQGIISLANFISSLLSEAFPQAVDKMDEERGQFNGPIPTLFVGIGAKVLASRLIGLGDMSEKIADFGAEQVILVRDESTKEKVKADLGEVALVLTILDSKGMEFDDVFLLDFFTSSPCLSIIRRLKAIFDAPLDIHREEEFKSNALLCSELKHLYVAVTRARNQLWIFESSNEAAEPVVELFNENKRGSGPLVEVARRTDPNINDKLKQLKPAIPSDPKRYSEQGYQLLQRGLYREANFCFKKANDEKGLTITGAHLKMEEGRGYRADGKPEKFLQLFAAAVDLFRAAGQSGNAAFCLEEMNRLEEAGDIWFEIRNYDKAASLFTSCGAWRKAYETYDTIASYIKLCTILITQGRISSDFQPLIIDALGSDDEKEEFFRKFKLTKQLVTVLKSKLQYGKAFQELLFDGKLKDALRLGLEHIEEDASIPAQEVVKLVHYMEFQKMIEYLPGRAMEWPQISCHLSKLPESLSHALSEWDSLRVSLIGNCLRDVLSRLKDGFYKDLLSVAVGPHLRPEELRADL